MTISSTIAWAEAKSDPSSPGSPWMPTPISISLSPSSKFGLPAAGTVQDVNATPMERVRRLTRWPSACSSERFIPASGGGADNLLDDQRAGDAATSGRIGRSLDRHVIVGNDRGTTAIGHFRRHFEVHHVAFIVLDDQHDALSLIDGLDRGEHLVWRGRGENLPGASGVQHAEADKSGVQRLVPRAAAGDERQPCQA